MATVDPAFVTPVKDRDEPAAPLAPAPPAAPRARPVRRRAPPASAPFGVKVAALRDMGVHAAPQVTDGFWGVTNVHVANPLFPDPAPDAAVRQVLSARDLYAGVAVPCLQAVTGDGRECVVVLDGPVVREHQASGVAGRQWAARQAATREVEARLAYRLTVAAEVWVPVTWAALRDAGVKEAQYKEFVAEAAGVPVDRVGFVTASELVLWSA
jgi:hypothetical protein